MPRLADDCFALGAAPLSTFDALALLEDRVETIADQESVPLRRAIGRFLAEDVTAERDVPPHDNAAVDGFAVCFDDLDPAADTRLPVTGRVAAGHPLGRPGRRGEAVRIFTGAPMPDGLDTVLMQEDCPVDGDTVIIRPGARRGANRRRAGEDMRTGDVVLTSGRRLRAQDVGLAAAVGRTALQVFTPLRAAVFSTGDEVAEPGDPLPAGAIYDANRYALTALLEGLGCVVDDLGILPDRFETIRDALDRAAADHDIILTSGGMSVGDEDHVKGAVEALGALHLWLLAIKPGRPIGFGQVKGVPFVGLPGNPVAMMVTFQRIARPMILKLAGGAERTPKIFRVPADFEMTKKAGRREWLRARLAADPDGRLVAHHFPREGSGILSSMVHADGLVELPEALTRVAPGDLVDFLPFSEVER